MSHHSILAVSVEDEPRHADHYNQRNEDGEEADQRNVAHGSVPPRLGLIAGWLALWHRSTCLHAAGSFAEPSEVRAPTSARTDAVAISHRRRLRRAAMRSISRLRQGSTTRGFFSLTISRPRLLCLAGLGGAGCVNNRAALRVPLPRAIRNARPFQRRVQFFADHLPHRVPLDLRAILRRHGPLTLHPLVDCRAGYAQFSSEFSLAIYQTASPKNWCNFLVHVAIIRHRLTLSTGIALSASCNRKLGNAYR